MAGNTQLMEHRWGIRMDVHAAAEVRTAGGLSQPASVRSASLSGAFLETDRPLPLMTRVSVRPLAKSDWLDAFVVRVDETGMAVEWVDPGLHPVYVFLSHASDATAPVR